MRHQNSQLLEPPDASAARAAHQLGEPAQQKRTISALTSLRFFVILCVVFNHGSMFFSCWRSLHCPLNLSQAVSFFFMLSGFVLTLNAKEMWDTRAVFKFYLARVARLWPMHVAGLIFLMLLLPEVFRLTNNLVPVFLSNLFLVHSLIPQGKYFFSYNAPSWTLSTMMCLYLFFPILHRAVTTRWHLAIGAGIVGVASLVSVCTINALPEFHASQWCIKGLIYVHPLSRLMEFVVGMLAAVVFRRYAASFKLSAPAATLMEVTILTAVVYISACSSSWRAASLSATSNSLSLWLYNSGFTLIPFALLLLVISSERGLMSRTLSLPLFIRAGEISLAMYILHGIFIAFWGVRFPNCQSVASSLLYLAILFAASYLLFFAVERPARQLVLKLGEKLLPART